MDYFRHTPVRYRTILITAGILATLFLFQAYMHYHVYKDLKGMTGFNWWREAPVPYLNLFFWALLCPAVYRIMRLWPFSGRPILRTIGIHVGMAVVMATVHEVSTSTIYYLFLQSIGEFDIRDPFYQAWAMRSLAPGIFGRFMEYGVLMGVLVAAENARLRRREHDQLLALRHELQSTQLNALKKQLQPHFLFNTLNTVSALMDENVPAARTVLSRLGQLLRVTLDSSRQDLVTLERELDHLDNYLGIESERFSDRLRVNYDVPASLLQLPVPSMVLQPLVENAIKHGPDPIDGRVEITIRAQVCDQRLVLEVLDNGKGCKDVKGAMMNGGIGLRNVRDRVQLLYGEQGGFRIASPQARGFQVVVSFPAAKP
jgi:two-component system LytT family sensor kinase